MSDNVTIAIIAACGVAFTALCVLCGSVFVYLGQNRRLDDLRDSIKTLAEEFRGFKEIVNGKLQTIDNEIGNILDKLVKNA